MSDQLPRLVRLLPSGQFKIDIDRWVKRDDGQSRRVRYTKVLPRGTSVANAAAAAERMEADLISRALAVNGTDGWDEYVEQLYATPGSWLHVAVAKARSRSKVRAHRCPLTAQTLREALLRSKGRCEVTGLRFQVKDAALGRQRPFMHSIDRIDSSLGYEATNIRIVCFAVNAAMNQWGDSVFAEIACGYVFNKYSAFQVMRERDQPGRFSPSLVFGDGQENAA